MLIKGKEKIVEIFNIAIKENQNIIIFFNKKVLPNVLLNVFGSIIKLTKTEIELKLENINLDLNQDKTDYKEGYFIFNYVRYSFDLKIKKVKEISEHNYEISFALPTKIDMRPVRRHERVNNSKLDDLSFVKDVSISGMSIIINKTQKFTKDQIVKIKLLMPFNTGATFFYTDLEFQARIARVAEFDNKRLLYGIEYLKLNSLKEMLLYHFIIVRKNEELFSLHEIPPIKLKNMSAVNM